MAFPELACVSAAKPGQQRLDPRDDRALLRDFVRAHEN
jgi:hypothetical protein